MSTAIRCTRCIITSVTQEAAERLPMTVRTSTIHVDGDAADLSSASVTVAPFLIAHSAQVMHEAKLCNTAHMLV